MLKIRLKRIGKKKAPFYRIVVADARNSVSNSRNVAEIGTYDPLKEPTEFKINEEEAKKWLGCGAQPTETVTKLFKKAGITN